MVNFHLTCDLDFWCWGKMLRIEEGSGLRGFLRFRALIMTVQPASSDSTCRWLVKNGGHHFFRSELNRKYELKKRHLIICRGDSSFS